MPSATRPIEISRGRSWGDSGGESPPGAPLVGSMSVPSRLEVPALELPAPAATTPEASSFSLTQTSLLEKRARRAEPRSILTFVESATFQTAVRSKLDVFDDSYDLAALSLDDHTLFTLDH